MKSIVKYRLLFTLLTAVFIVFRIYPQDSTRLAEPDNNRIKPIVQVFGNFEYNPTKGVTKDYSFWFGRAHLGLQYQFSGNWSAKVIIDRGKPTTVGIISVTDSAGNTYLVNNTSKEGATNTMFLKFASLQWKVTDKFTLEGGAVLQNHYITQEKFWGYRYVAETFQDRYYGIPSSDLGVIAYYKLSRKIRIDAALTNGEGPRIDQDSKGGIKLASGIDFNPGEHFITRVFYHHNASGVEDRNTAEQLFSVFAGYRWMQTFRLGGEFTWVDGYKNYSNLTSWGYSFFGSLAATRKTNIFLRFDRLVFQVPDNMTAAIYANGNAYIGGINYSPVQGISFSINYQGFDYDSPTQKMQHRLLLSTEFKL
mgnify:CR=1 FL=1